jgi:O-acetyl-ADP-ribose deacetylase (regulator of RNase III)
MSLKIEVGDLFNETMGKEDCILVHGCNAQGIMGSGVAAVVKKLYPRAYTVYKNAKYYPGLKVGDVSISVAKGECQVANAVTQEYYGRDGKQYVSYDGVVEAMVDIASYAKANNLKVHLPMIGGGLGGGDVKRLTAIFQAAFHDVDATLWLQEN